MLIVRLAGDYLMRNSCSLVMSLMASFFPRDVSDENWNLIESVSEGFPSYFCQNVNHYDI